MKIKTGDKVKFLNDVGGGTVTKIIDKDTVLVLNDTGFEIPILINELLIDLPQDVLLKTNEISIAKEETNIFEESPIYTKSEDVNLYLAFVPKDQNMISDSDSDVYVINDSNYFILYNYAVKEGNKYLSRTGKLEPNVKEKIDLLEMNSLQEKLNIVVQLIFYDKKKFALKEPVSNHLKIKSSKFFEPGCYKENDFFDVKALIITIIEDNPLKEAVEMLSQKEMENLKELKTEKKKIPFKKKENKNIKEVDLHIHELVDNETGLSDQDKLQHQLEVFRREMELAIKENYRRIVFIHGVGSGSLKLKLRNELQTKYKKYQFQDASFKEYGYGATMVLLRR